MTAPQKTRIDWGAAKAFYIGLPPEKRTFAAVVREFHVSLVTVRKWARRDEWEKAAGEADRQVNEQAIRRAVKSRGERVAHSLRFVDNYMDAASTKLKAGKLDVRASDVPALVKLAELLEGEATDRIQVGEVRALIANVVVIAGEFVPRDSRSMFLERLGEVMSGLDVVEGGS